MKKNINNFKQFISLNESNTYELLNLDELKSKFTNMIFTLNPLEKFPNMYFVKVEILMQNDEIKYLGALRGPVNYKIAIEFLNSMANSEYDKYY